MSEESFDFEKWRDSFVELNRVQKIDKLLEGQMLFDSEAYKTLKVTSFWMGKIQIYKESFNAMGFGSRHYYSFSEIEDLVDFSYHTYQQRPPIRPVTQNGLFFKVAP